MEGGATAQQQSSSVTTTSTTVTHVSSVEGLSPEAMEAMRQAAAEFPELRGMLDGMLNDGALRVGVGSRGTREISHSSASFQLTGPDGTLDLNEARRLHRHLEQNPHQRAFLQGQLDQVLAQSGLTIADLEQGQGASHAVTGGNDWGVNDWSGQPSTPLSPGAKSAPPRQLVIGIMVLAAIIALIAMAFALL